MTTQLPAALPYPAVLPSLQQLVIHQFIWEGQWLRQLEGLPRLKLLSLHGCYRQHSSDEDAAQQPGEHAEQPPPGLMVPPPLQHITRLVLSSSSGWPIRVAPADFPSLQELELQSLGGPIDIVASPCSASAGSSPGSRDGSRQHSARGSSSNSSGSGGRGSSAAGGSALTHLHFDSQPAYLNGRNPAGALDFATLPALRNMQLWWGGMEDISSLGVATALTSLHLESVECMLLSPWAAAVLRAAPTTLRRLRLSGEWGREEAAAVGSMGQLQLLDLDGFQFQDRPPPPPPAGAAVWRSLRSFRYWVTHGSTELPAVSRMWLRCCGHRFQ